MTDLRLKGGSDYHTFFDSKAYLSGYYPGPGGQMELTNIVLDFLHEIYSTGKVKGKRIIDVGSGPTIHMLIPAAKWFDELFIAEFSKRNLETQRKWLARDLQSFDWQPYYRYFAQKDGKEEAWSQYEELLRGKVKGILSCDYHQPNPLHPETMGQFDAVSTSLALECGNKDVEQFKESVKNIVSLVAPGGYFILYTCLKSPHFWVGDEKFWVLPLTREEVLDSVKETSLEVIQSFEGSCGSEEDFFPYDGAIMVLGRKKL